MISLKKRTLLLLTFLCIVKMFPQDPNDLPKIFPASPEASNLGRFGEIPVNLSVGMANFSVPVYTIQESGFELPISINYQHNGLMVDQIPGHLGMGWNLSAGGMITRQMRGRPDEDNAGYIGSQMTGKNIVVPYITNQLSAEERNTTHQLASENLIDLQPDKFIASAGNMSVTFYFDENKVPVIKPYKPYKIEPINNDFSFNQGIKITDDNGIQYFFQEIERTTRTQPISLNEIAGSMNNGYTSGWKLSKVILVNKKEITFDYDATIHYQSTKSQSFTEWISGDPNCSSSPLTTSTRNYQITSKIIRKITFPKGNIEFNNTIVTLSDNNDNKNKYLSRLDNIKVHNQNDDLITTYNLYFDNLNKTRKLLNQVRINNDLKNLYSFEYYGVPQDNINFYEQDFWGYYNSNPYNFLINSYNTYDVFGSRKPDFARTRIGALKKITYPTKGYSEIEYEQNTVDAVENEVPYTCQTANLEYIGQKSVSLNWQEQNQGTEYKSDELTFTIEEGLQYISINLTVKKDANGGAFGNFVYGLAKASLSRVGGTTVGCADIECYSGPAGQEDEGCDGVYRSIGGPTHFSTGEKVLNRKYKLKPGTYTLKVEVQNYGVAFTSGDILIASASISKQVAPRVISETGGIRITKIKNCPNDTTSECIQKEFIYEDQDGNSYGKLFRKRNITKYRLNAVNNTVQNLVCSAVYDVYSSSSNVPLGYFMGSHVFYDTVIEKTKGSDDTYLGHTKKTFVCSPVEQNLTFPFLDVDNKEFKNGKPIKEEIYNNSSSNPIQVKEYTYDFDGNGNSLYGVNQRVYALSIGVISANNTESGPNGYASNNTVFRNNIDREWLTKIKTTEVLNNKSLITDQSYKYLNPQGFVKEDETINSDGKIIVTKNWYPDEVSNTTILGESLTSSEYNAIGNLKKSGEHRIITPIQTEVYVNGILQTKRRTNFAVFSGNTVIKEIQTGKRTFNLEDKIVYHEYDNYGNPTEVSKANGAHISYIWGYDKQYPVAKIENATRAQIEALSGFGANFHTGASGLSASQESTLRNGLANALITTYSYEPLIGITSMTDPKGYTMTYHYDAFNRLEFVKDQQGNLVSENKYNYKN